MMLMQLAVESMNHATLLGAAAADPLGHKVGHGLIHLAANTDYKAAVDAIAKTQEEHLGWLTTIGKHFIGVFQQGGQVFVGFVTGIIPTLVVLMTAFYAVIGLVGEDRVHGLARAAGRIALTRYTVLPLIAVFFLTNPMAYTFGSFLEEKPLGWSGRTPRSAAESCSA